MTGLFCGKWRMKIRHPTTLWHPVVGTGMFWSLHQHVYEHVHRSFFWTCSWTVHLRHTVVGAGMFWSLHQHVHQHVTKVKFINMFTVHSFEHVHRDKGRLARGRRRWGGPHIRACSKWQDLPLVQSGRYRDDLGNLVLAPKFFQKISPARRRIFLRK